MRRFFFLIGIGFFLNLGTANVQANELWYQYAISPQNNANVKFAHSIFDDLLSLSSANTKPKLIVVYTHQGSWAAALADGTILLSETAIKLAIKSNRRTAKNKIAYILAHELALYELNKTWHRRYFQIVGTVEKQATENLRAGLPDGIERISDLLATFRQANRNAIMSLEALAYDSSDLLKNERFFSAWIQSAWGKVCEQEVNKNDQLCTEPGLLLANIRDRYNKNFANQLAYNIGLQAYISGEYELARIYFEKVLREFKHKKIHLLIGLCYVNEALASRGKYTELGGYHKNLYTYPLMIDSAATVPRLYQRIMGLDSKTGNEFNIEKEAVVYKTQINRAIGFAIKEFQKALEIDSKYKLAVSGLIAANLTNNNTAQANKLLFSSYVINFGSDEVSSMYSGILHASNRRYRRAEMEFKRLLKSQDSSMVALSYVNLAKLYEIQKQISKAEEIWQSLKKYSKGLSDSSVKSVTDPISYRVENAAFTTNKRLLLNKIKPGDSIADENSIKNPLFRLPVALLGKQLTYVEDKDGGRMLINDQGYVHAAWQTFQAGNTGKYRWLIKKENKLIKKLGAPNRLVYTLAGKYMVYSELGVVFRSQSGEIRQWFYLPKGH